MSKDQGMEGPSFGDGIPAKYTSWEYANRSIRITSVSEWNENGVGIGPKRTVVTNIVYADHARELAKWLMKIAKIMDGR